MRLGLLVGSSLATLALALGSVAAQTVPARSPSTFDAFGVPLTAAQFDTPEYRADWGLAAINAATAYARGFTGNGVLVAVVDSGIDPNHPEFNNRFGRISPYSRNFIPPNDPFLLGDTDPKSHGTHVAGTIAAARNGTGMMGVAFDSTLLALFDLTNTANAIDYPAQQKARVLNGSYGPAVSEPFDSNGIPNPTYRRLTTQEYTLGDINEYRAIKRAVDRDMLLVFAAGNERLDQPDVTTSPTGAALYPFIKPENANSGIYQFYTRRGLNSANMESVDVAPVGPVDQSKIDFSSLSGYIMSVVAVDSSNRIAWFSNLCGVTAAWCIAAPGTNIYSTVQVGTGLNGSNYGSKSP